jgi:uracil permease
LKGGLIVAGLIYLIFAMITKWLGSKRVIQWLPAVVTGPVIITIGLKLIPMALEMVGYSNTHIEWTSVFLALLTLGVMVIVSFVEHSFFKLMPILIALAVGYVVAMMMGQVDLGVVYAADWFGLSDKDWGVIGTLPKFSWASVGLVAPVALVTLMEHIGDVESNGQVVGKNFLEYPGLHRSLAGDGFATIVSGFLGGPANTTYGENTGVLVATKNYNPGVLRMAAVIAIGLAFCGKLIGVIQSVPVAVMGGVSLLLFGLIASIGLRSMAKVNLSDYRNLVIVSIILILGIFVDEIRVGANFAISGQFLATMSGIILHQVLPR